MKKITLAFLVLIAISGKMKSQAVLTIQAPQYDGGTSPLCAPSGSSDAVYHRACFLIKASELSSMVLTNSIVTSVGFTFLQGITGAAVAGNYTIYMQNTSDVTYNKGLTWAATLPGMSTNYTGLFTLPVTNGSTVVTLPLTTNFTYTGGGIYIACDWYAPTANSAQMAVYACNYAGLTNGASRAWVGSAGPAPTTMTASNWRPAVELKAQNTATNELAVISMSAVGKVSKLAGIPQIITADIKNASIGTKTAVVVALGVSGANIFTDTKTITTINAGSVQTVAFSAFTPANNGVNNMTVSILPDQYTANNLTTWTQSVTCNTFALPPAVAAGAYTSQGYGAGASATGIIYAFKYTSPTVASSLVSVSCVIPSFTNASNSGKQLYPVLADASGNIIATGNTITIGAADMDIFKAISFANPPALTPNTQYLYGIATNTNGYFPVGSAAGPGVVYNFYQIPVAGGSPTQVNYGYLSLEASLGFSNTTIGISATKTVVCNNKAPNTVQQSVTLTATGPAATAPGVTFLWNTSSTATQIVVNPSITATSGVINYTLNATDGASGCKATQAVLTLSLQNCSGIAENNDFGSGINVYPNPSVNNKTTVNGLEGTNTITVFNMLGQAVLSSKTSEESINLDLSGQAAGTYLIKITNVSNQSKTIKLVN